MEYPLRYLIVIMKSITEPFLQKVFPCVTLLVSLNIFQVLNHFGSVYGDDDVSFV